jgi:hypothetical protein
MIRYQMLRGLLRELRQRDGGPWITDSVKDRVWRNLCAEQKIENCRRPGSPLR